MSVRVDHQPAFGQQLITATTAGAVGDSRTYNTYGEPESYTATVSGTPVLAVTYQRDDLGRISAKTETIEGVTTTYEYGYDTAGRLVGASKTPDGGSTMVATYSYDDNGNRLATVDDSGITTAVYDDQDRLLAYGDITYSYNAHGDLTSKSQNNATVTYDYDVFGNLRHVTLDNGIAIDYVIDARNRRVGKKVNDTLVQGFLYDDQLRPVAELDGANQVAATFVYGTRVNVPELILKEGTTYRIIHDHLGSPRVVVNSSDGSIAQRLDYDEWGVVTLDTNPGFQPFGFAGGLYDPQTKLVRFGLRDYDAQTGRWTSKDPLLFAGLDANLFSYVHQAPTLYLDPSGGLQIPEWVARDYPRAYERLVSLIKRWSRAKFEAFLKYGGACRADVVEALTPGRGPTVVIRDLPLEWGGVFDPRRPDEIQLNYRLLQDLENGAGGLTLDATTEHELIHYFAHRTGTHVDGIEEGNEYGIEIYGVPTVARRQ